MARLYRVPADISEPEKIIGGIFTLAQGLYIAAGLILSALIFYLLQLALTPLLALIIALPPGLAFAYAFAIHKVKDLSLMTYLRLSFEMKRKTKYLVNDYCYGKEKE